jgi:hypothetical protein
MSSFFFLVSVLSFFTRWQVWRLGGDDAGFRLLLWLLLLEAERRVKEMAWICGLPCVGCGYVRSLGGEEVS